MEQLVEQFLRSPKLEIYLEQINAARAEEQLVRQRFLDQFREGDKAEFINGEIIVHSPARVGHNLARQHLTRLASTYVDTKHLGVVGDEKWLVSLTRNDYEPDVSFWNQQKSSKFEFDQMRFPAPDWIAEVLSPSTESLDRGVKFEDYAAHGVGEYWIVDAEKRVIEQYTLSKAGGYELVLKSSNGIIRSSAIDGFAISIEAVFDDAKNMESLKALLA